MASRVRLLFSNVGRRTYLVEFALALHAEGYPLDVFVSDTSPETAGFWVSDAVRTIVTPRLDDGDEAYADVLLGQAVAHGIDLIVPLMDFELPVLARRRADFERQGVRVVVSSSEVVDACLDKRANYELCRRHGIPVPESYFSKAEVRGELPLVAKRIRGSGSVGLRHIGSAVDVSGVDFETEFLQRPVDGPEYGVDILNDFEGRLLSVSIKQKLAMRVGETDKAVIVDHPAIRRLAARVSGALRHVGNMDVDVLEDATGTLYCIDFNPRFGGGYPATHVSGLNYLKALLDLSLGQTPAFPPQQIGMVVLKGVSIHSYRGPGHRAAGE